MANQSTIDRFGEIFESCCCELFEPMAVSFTRVDPGEHLDEEDPIGVLDAGSQDVEITLCLQLPMHVLSLTYPSSGGTITNVSEEALEDWVAELCNQLIGKIKNNLLKFGVRMNIGLPSAYFGADLAEVLPQGTQLVYYFSIDGEVLAATLVVDIKDDGLVLQEESGFDEGPGGGELELF
ncbi:MAG: chemotaxis protein CheX [Pseudomonadales bacterium]|nr:chemotaxis protein CheX [Pseudomonadales bacterium]